MAVYDFSDKMMSGKPINVFSHGVLQRDFTYVDDTVNGIIAAMNYGADFEVCVIGAFVYRLLLHLPVEELLLEVNSETEF